MGFGPFARIIAQIGIVAGGAIAKAAAEAYKEAAAGRGVAGQAAQKVARRRMSVDEARNVLGVEAGTGEKAIQERFDVLYKLNTATEESAGSPYLQTKITAARNVLIDELVKAGKAEAPKEEAPKEGGAQKPE